MSEEMLNATHLYFSGCWLFHPLTSTFFFHPKTHPREDGTWVKTLLTLRCKFDCDCQNVTFSKMMSTSGLWRTSVFFLSKDFSFRFVLEQKNLISDRFSFRGSLQVGILGYPWRSKVIHYSRTCAGRYPPYN